jgi:hypothetical protein
MTNGTGVYGGAAGAYVAMINAIKASGAIVEVEPNEFMEILIRAEEPLVVFSRAKWFVKNKYMTSYKGLFFYTKTATLLPLPEEIEIVQSKKIWIPG